MKDINHKEKAKRLCILCLIFLIISGSCASAFLNSKDELERNASLEVFSSYQFAALAIILFCSCPLLLSIRHHARIARLKTIEASSCVILLHHIIWIILLASEMVCSLLI